MNTVLRIPNELHKALTKLSKATGISINRLILIAVRRFLFESNTPEEIERLTHIKLDD